METTKKKSNNTITFIAIAILGLIALGLKKCKESRDYYPERKVTTTEGNWRNHKITCKDI